MRRALFLMLLVACSKHEEPQPGDQAKPAASDPAADRIYGAQCTSCHGPAGKGDGPMAMQLGARPQDLGDPAWQHSVTDDDIGKIIVLGGAGVGKNGAMPPHPDLGEKPDALAGLVAKIRAFSR